MRKSKNSKANDRPIGGVNFESNMRIIIISRGRSDSMTAHNVFPMATLVCPESEASAYEKYGLEIVTTPDNVIGLGKLRNWILDHFKEEILVMADDDIYACIYLGSLSPKTYHNDAVISYQVVVAGAICAKDLGVGAFGFSQTWDVRKYRVDMPFRLNTYAGGVVGVIGRGIRFLERNMFKVDIDFFLEQMLKNRIVWIDTRWGFLAVRERNLGGNSLFRTEERIQDEIDFLKRKWQSHFNCRKAKTTIVSSINVKR